jgi:hypothetical protein
LPELGTPATTGAAPASSGGASPSTNAEANLFDDTTAALRARTAARPPGLETEPKPMSAADGGGTPATGSPSGAPVRSTDTGRAVVIGTLPGSASLIGDALLRELIDNTGRSDDPHPVANGHDDPSVDSRTDRRSGGHGDVEHGYRTSANGVSPVDGHTPGSAPRAREADPGVADTVVFELDPRHDSTVAVPPVLPTRDTGAGRAHRRPGRDTELDLPQTDTTDARPPHRAAGTGYEVPAATPRSDGRASVGADTVRVGRPADPGQPTGRPGAAATPGPDGSRGVTGRERTPGGPDAADPPAPGDRRRRSTPDTDGLGIGDLLAGALAAYRGI